MGSPTSSTMPYLNRELSWLAFNERVLEEALDERVPLLERLKFLAIFSTNLDEFYMVRVAGLRRKVAVGAVQYPPDTLSPTEQLEAIREGVKSLIARRNVALKRILLPRLAEHGLALLSLEETDDDERQHLTLFFEEQVFPVLTPLAVDPGHPFPYISNLSLSLAVEVQDPETGEGHFARVKVPRSLSRWVSTGRTGRFVSLERVIGEHLGWLFPGMEVRHWFAFRITRYSDLDLGQIEQPEDLLETIEERVLQRRFGEVVRLEVQSDMPRSMRELLLHELSESETRGVTTIEARDVHDQDELLELGDLLQLAALDIPGLRDAQHVPLVPQAFRDGRSIFDMIRERDVIVHHPYESFDASVESFLQAAASDPQVLAIKMTLYRTTGDMAIERALTEAAEAGKQVAILVELQARFDEASNINFARNMENNGIHVAYGLPGLKTHAKTVLVVRRDSDGLRRYVHIGTGNYNSRTARLYTDVGLFTCNPLIGADLSDLFNSLTGVSRQKRYRRIVVAPGDLRSRTLELINRETDHATAGRGGRIIAKMNALVDPDIIAALYRASGAGVTIDLIVRGICCLLPGIPDTSENIRVISIIGRFLEHSRILHFANAGAPEYYISSADWMPRNFDRRVEVMAPVESRTLHTGIQYVLETCLADNRQAWELGSDGRYRRRTPGSEPQRATQTILMLDPWGSADGSAGRRRL